MAFGKIVAFDRVKGCGLIAPDDGSSKVFVHADDLDGQRHINIGTPVRFSSIQGIRGPKAYNVRILTALPDRLGMAVDPRDDGSATADIDCDEDHFLKVQILSHREYAVEITDVLISVLPDATSAQIVQVRSELAKRAVQRGWLGALADHVSHRRSRNKTMTTLGPRSPRKRPALNDPATLRDLGARRSRMASLPPES